MFSNTKIYFLALLLLFFGSYISAQVDEYENTNLTHSSMRSIENKGQWEKNIKFRVNLTCGYLFMEKNAFTYNFIKDEDLVEIMDQAHHGTNIDQIHGHALNVKFVNSNPQCSVSGLVPHPTKYNYFLGNDRSKWASGALAYQGIKYQSIYPNTDLFVYEKSGHLKYDFVLAPNANPDQIRIKYDGAESIVLKEGKVVIETSVNTITEQNIVSYQIIDGVVKQVPSHFALNSEGEITFKFPQGYDPSHPLIIDPELIFSTYSGSTGDNWGYTATYDQDGNAYSGGIAYNSLQDSTYSGYPVTIGAFQSDYASGLSDVAISKYSPDGVNLLYATYLGGDNIENPMSIVATDDNELVIIGNTNSINFPTTTLAYDTILNDGISTTHYDLFIAKLSEDGTALLGSTYMGGNEHDGFNQMSYFYGDNHRSEVIVDSSNNIYVASNTSSVDFPATSGSFDTTKSGLQDAVVFKLDSNCSNLVWSGFLGGILYEQASGIALDSAHNVYVCGATGGGGFPVSATAVNNTYSGGINSKGTSPGLYGSDGFVLRISEDGSTILASTFLQSTDAKFDIAYLVETDEDQNVYVYGVTEGFYPITAGTYSNPQSTQFIHKLSPNLDNTIFSSTFGSGSNAEVLAPTALLVDNCFRIYVSGWGGSFSFGSGATNSIFNYATSTDAIQSTTDGSDFYLAVFDENMTGLNYATYYGGNNLGDHVDGGTSRFSPDGVVYQAVCAGCGGNPSSFPATAGVYSEVNASSNCNAALFKMEFAQYEVEAALDQLAVTTVFCTSTNIVFENNSKNANGYQWYFDDGDSIITASKNSVSHFFADSGFYQVMLISTNDGNCFIKPIDTAYYNVQIILPYLEVEANLTSPDDTLCLNSTASFINLSTNANRHKWFFGDGDSSLIFSLFNPSHIYDSAGTYTVTLISSNDGDCFLKPIDTAYYNIVMIDPYLNAEAIFSIDTNILCPGRTVTFENLSINGDQYTWTLNTNKKFITFSDSTVSYTYIQEGDYEVSLVATYQGDPTCFDRLRDTMTQIIRIVRPTIFAGVDTSVLPCEQLQLEGCCGISYYWRPTEFFDDHNLQNPILSPVKSDFYTLTVIDSLGCVGEDTFYVNVQEPEFTFPNIFTPNNDHLNDTFTISGVCDFYHLKFYNRWGKKVYDNPNCNNDFDGLDLPDGMYYYDVEINEDAFHGWVKISR